MLWLFSAVGAYFLFAFSSLVDRYLLAGSLPHPRTFAFYTGVTGVLAAVLIPFGFQFPSLGWALFALAVGAVTLLGLYASYRAVFHSGVSRIVPMVGALFPMFTFLMVLTKNYEYEAPSPTMFAAFALFTLGTVLLALQGGLREFRPSWHDLLHSALVAFLFALGFVLGKAVYDHEGFVNGFIWMRWGSFLAAVSFLASPVTRQVVFQKNPAGEKKVALPFLLGKGAGSAAFLLQQFAISATKTFQLTIVSALQGVQYLFLLLLVAILARKKPGLLKEEFTGSNKLWRIAGVGCLLLGFAALAL